MYQCETWSSSLLTWHSWNHNEMKWQPCDKKSDPQSSCCWLFDLQLNWRPQVLKIFANLILLPPPHLPFNQVQTNIIQDSRPFSRGETPNKSMSGNNVFAVKQIGRKLMTILLRGSQGDFIACFRSQYKSQTEQCASNLNIELLVKHHRGMKI